MLENKLNGDSTRGGCILTDEACGQADRLQIDVVEHAWFHLGRRRKSAPPACANADVLKFFCKSVQVSAKVAMLPAAARDPSMQNKIGGWGPP